MFHNVPVCNTLETEDRCLHVHVLDFEIITETTVRRQISTRIHDQQRSAPSLVTTGQTDPTPSDSQSSFELGDFVLPSKGTSYVLHL